MLPQTDDEAEIADHAFIHMWTNGDEMVELDVAAKLVCHPPLAPFLNVR
jgi:hypothetical protein